MGMNTTPSPVTSPSQIKGVLSPFYVVGEYNGSNWNRIQIDLWIWKGANDAVVNEDPNYVLTKSKINNDDDKVEINIANYVADTINPVFSIGNSENNTSDNSFFYYEIKYFNDSTLVTTSSSTLMIGVLGWRYDYQMFNLVQEVGGEYFPNGRANSEFGYFNLNSKENYFKYTEAMVNVPGRIWYTNRSFPISDISTSQIYYGDLATYLQPNQIECNNVNYGIVFINKSGNWDLFPVFGKVNISTEKSSTTYNRGFRYKTEYTDRYQNSVREVNTMEQVTYTVNTGVISELMSLYLESILYSPMMFIVDYNTNLSFPVKLQSTTLSRKTKLNDKNNINHTLVFIGDNPKMLKY